MGKTVVAERTRTVARNIELQKDFTKEQVRFQIMKKELSLSY